MAMFYLGSHHCKATVSHLAINMRGHDLKCYLYNVCCRKCNVGKAKRFLLCILGIHKSCLNYFRGLALCNIVDKIKTAKPCKSFYKSCQGATSYGGGVACCYAISRSVNFIFVRTCKHLIEHNVLFFIIII